MINHTLPPKITLIKSDPDLQAFTLIDTAAMGLSQEKKEMVIREAYYTFITSLESGFRENLGKEFLIEDSLVNKYHSSMARYNKAGINPAFTEETGKAAVEVMAREQFKISQVPYLLFISNFDIHRDQSMEVNENEDGSKERIAHYSVVSSVILSFYKYPGILNDLYTAQAMEEIDSRSVISGLLAIGPQIKNYGEVMNRQARQMSAQYLQQFLPRNIMVRRSYYADRELKALAPLMKEQRWKDIILPLKDLYENPKSVSLKHVAHNLSIAYEALGDEQEANDWKQKSKK
jgi:hypothetical protein